MNIQPLTAESTEFKAIYDVELDALLLPISAEQPAGKNLRNNGVYSAIKEARRFDDELSQGVWQHDLKKADWHKVSHIAVDAIEQKTKDLQIAIWLLEAKVHQHGFAALAPGLLLISKLCEQYWQDLHPQILDGDLEYRINPILWADEKLLPALKLVPVTQLKAGAEDYNWADWELANRNEEISQLAKSDALHTSANVQDIKNALNHTPIEFHQHNYTSLVAATQAVTQLNQILEQQCGNQAPAIAHILHLMDMISSTLEQVIRQRGAIPGTQLQASSAPDPDARTIEQESATQHLEQSDGGGGGNNSGAIQSRQQAYEKLSQAAEYLMRIEPHSPAPYLVVKAIEWGNLSTPELYQELFVQYQGQLNIFEVLGLQLENQS